MHSKVYNKYTKRKGNEKEMKKETLDSLKTMVQREIFNLLYNDKMLEWAKETSIRKLQEILKEIEGELGK